MPSYLDILCSKAFHSMPGMAYNKYRSEHDDRSGPKSIYYEVSLLESKPWSYLSKQIYPSFCRFLKAKFIDPEKPEGVIVVLFHETQCSLITGEDFLEAFKEIEGLNSAVFHFKVLEWISNR